MSARALATQAVPSRPLRPTQPSISRAPATNTRKSRATLFAALSIAGIVVIACGQLLITIASSDTAYQVAALRTEQKDLSRTSDILRQELDTMKSPQFLSANAEALGMVRNSNPVFLRLSDGSVFGAPTPAAAGAGKVVGPSGNKVPNSLLNNRPLLSDGGTQQSGTTSPRPN